MTERVFILSILMNMKLVIIRSFSFLLVKCILDVFVNYHKAM